jgi:Xaa-Pro aminopeptidase
MSTIKSEKEIVLLKRSAAIANSCLPMIAKWLREDVTERELARRIRLHLKRRGASLAFRTLVASGKRSAMIHPKPNATDQRISGMGFVDFGASYRGYKSDITVPFVKGRITGRERKIIAATLGAYRVAVKSLDAGMECWVAHKRADDFLRKRGFAMKHALGHGLGKRIHDSPLIVAPRKKLRGKKLGFWQRLKRVTFQPGMVFTVEPGVYVEGAGGCRIENDFLLRKDKKFKALTNSRLLKV